MWKTVYITYSYVFWFSFCTVWCEWHYFLFFVRVCLDKCGYASFACNFSLFIIVFVSFVKSRTKVILHLEIEKKSRKKLAADLSFYVKFWKVTIFFFFCSPFIFFFFAPKSLAAFVQSLVSVYEFSLKNKIRSSC